MATTFSHLSSFARSRAARWLGIPMVLAAGAAALISQGQVTPLPTMDLAAEPLYARGARAKPTLTLALSVEFPTVGAQYRTATYSPSDQYIGYFDSESCYTYVNHSTPALRRFDRTGAATNRTCGGAGFSGNFMNWATSSSIDVLRYGLTGGDRVVDTSSLTVLQRAVLRTSFYRSTSYFPTKVISPEVADGAVPNALRGDHTGNIYIANCLNRVHFGTEAAGSCDSPGNNSNLGTASGATTVGSVSDFTGALPSDFSAAPCATEFGVCTVSGLTEVAFGSGTTWKMMTVTESVDCHTAVFGTSTAASPRACYTRPVESSDGSLSSDNFFYTRVRVCESSGSTLTDPRTDLCQRYPNGNYKPVGNLQKYSDRLRVAAFGYLNDSTISRYGGVLRAPMKYVGPKTYDSNFALASGTNPVAEWDESTGVFVANPEGQTSINSGSSSSHPGQPLSGVINYLNQFGRTGTAGQYKGYDPVSELYYESLRYLQGLDPTPEATSGMTDTMKDGFPVYTSWTDPHPAVTGMSDYSCVKNNIVGIGDVFTHRDKSIPGNDARSTLSEDFVRSDNLSGNEPDFHFWTKVVGGFESNNSVGYTDGNGDAQTTGNISLNSPYNTDRWGMENQNTGSGGTSAYYMAGMAYWANTHDIRGTQWTNTAKQRPGMRVRTYMIDVNENGSSTAAADRQDRQFYLTAKYGGFDDSSGTGNPFKQKQQDGTVTDSNANWAGTNGEAKTYFLASSAQALLDALDEIFATLAAEANSIAGGAISTQRLTSDNGYVYQAQFDPADWSGDLVALPISANASGVVSIGTESDSPWTNGDGDAVGAAGKLDDLTSPDTRKIFVGYNTPDTTPVFGTTEFVWDSLNAVTQEALRTPAYAASGVTLDDASVGEARLEYLRGDRSGEISGIFRRRGSRLGDIINSGVAFSGAPSLSFSDSAYASFASTYANRKKALYVGANDGMLHAFDAATGDELFAYIPSWLAPRLSNLTSASYVHASYMDGTPAVAEAKAGSDWKTVLVAGSGGGGQGVVALDVSDPEAFGNDKVMWEFTDRHDPEMGNVIGQPKILKVNVAAGSATPSYKYFAVFASGVNNYADDGYSLSTTDTNYGSPVLFLLDLGKSKSGAWVEGGNYYKIRFPVSDATKATGIANFNARRGSSGELTYLYAADMQGNLWKLDFTSTDADDWSLANLSYFKDGSDPIPMYVAKDADGNRQPVTMEPALVFGPNRNIIVAFGTGKFLEESDNAGPYRAQTVYALLDNNSPDADTASSPLAAIASRARLAQATTTDGATIDTPVFNWGRATADTGTTKSGWYYDFFHSDTIASGIDARSGTGERQISRFQVLAGTLVFGSVIPAVNSCDNGTGNAYIANLFTGDAEAATSTVGILGEPLLVQVGASTLDKSGTTGRRKEVSKWQIILQGSGGVGAPTGLSKNITTYPGRLTWREISNYQDLRNAP